MSDVFLIKDPLHEYAARFISLIHGKYGYRAICFFSDRKRRAYFSRKFPVLATPAVLASEDVDLDELSAFAARVGSAHHVVGVIPYSEDCVLAAAQLEHALQLGWNDSAVIARFRDKFALKNHIRRTEPSLRMNASSRVYMPDDVFRGGVARFGRYVIKPNGGFGNRDIGIFDAATPRAEVA